MFQRKLLLGTIVAVISLASLTSLNTVYATSNDRDKDGVLDKNDACPDVPGPLLQSGCPKVGTEVDYKLIKDKVEIYRLITNHAIDAKVTYTNIRTKLVAHPSVQIVLKGKNVKSLDKVYIQDEENTNIDTCNVKKFEDNKVRITCKDEQTNGSVKKGVRYTLNLLMTFNSKVKNVNSTIRLINVYPDTYKDINKKNNSINLPVKSCCVVI